MGRDSRVNNSVRRHEVVGETLANHRDHLQNVIGWIQAHAKQHTRSGRLHLVKDVLFAAAIIWLAVWG